jgi:hypothetical protein
MSTTASACSTSSPTRQRRIDRGSFRTTACQAALRAARTSPRASFATIRSSDSSNGLASTANGGQLARYVRPRVGCHKGERHFSLQQQPRGRIAVLTMEIDIQQRDVDVASPCQLDGPVTGSRWPYHYAACPIQGPNDSFCQQKIIFHDQDA